MPQRSPSGTQGKDPSPGDGPATVSGEDARQGQIVLNTPRRRWIFFGGLIAFVLLVIVMSALT